MKFCKRLLSLFLVLQILACNLLGLTAVSAKEIVSKTNVAKSRPKVSVIVPVYNVEPYLRECLDSLKNQTLKDIEIICIDDGSPDNCGKILDEYAKTDDRFIVIHQENKGLPMARQAGMDIAKGEYIKHVDSDDYIDLQTLEICYNEAKKDDVDILAHGAYAFNQEKQWVHTQLPYQLITNQQFRVIAGYGCFILYKNDFLRKNELNFHDVKNMSEDRCFIMKCTPCAKKIKTIPNLLYYYRQHNSSLRSKICGKKRAQDHIHNICNIYRYWEKRGYFSKKSAQIGFLKDVLVWNLWPNDTEICKMFYNMLNSLDKNLLTDKKIISQLSSAEKIKLNRILDAGKTRVKQTYKKKRLKKNVEQKKQEKRQFTIKI